MRRLILSIIYNGFDKLLVVCMVIGFMASCDSVLDFKEGDCSYQYKVKFKYDYNMKYADAFHSLVSTVTLYAFGEDGKLVFQNTNSGDMLKDENYAMKLDVDPGKYHLIAWAGLDNKSFAVPLLKEGSSTLQELTVKTRRVKNSSRSVTSYGEVGDNLVTNELTSLWHGEITSTDVVLSRSRDTILTVPLIKNTNTIRVVIVQAASQESMARTTSRTISKSSFDYKLCDNNGFMNYDNSLLADSMLTYVPYLTADSVIAGASASSDKVHEALAQITGRSEKSYKAVVAEISTARLLTSQTPQLSIVNNTTKKEVLPTNNLIKYLNLLKEANYRSMPLQEYLDREDHFDMVLFVDENLTLIQSCIVVNDWIIQLNNFDF
jgi:hypothetical protein